MIGPLQGAATGMAFCRVRAHYPAAGWKNVMAKQASAKSLRSGKAKTARGGMDNAGAALAEFDRICAAWQSKEYLADLDRIARWADEARRRQDSI